MADELRDKLRKVDGSALSIQTAAGAMMKHYDRAAVMAVTEWRNALQTITHPQTQVLPLLYVANEVVQTSKRNRGNKFLEAFSPILKQSIIYMISLMGSSDNTTTTIDKIRRTIQIWAQRQVFSTRFVNDLLASIEKASYKQHHVQQHIQQQQDDNINFEDDDDDDAPTFSPPAGGSTTTTTQATTTSSATSVPTPNQEKDDDDDDDIMDILDSHDNSGRSRLQFGEEDDNDGDDMFIMGNDSDRPSLQIEVNVDAAVSSVGTDNHTASQRIHQQKRRRSSGASTGSQGNHGSTSKRHKVVLSMGHLLELLHQLNENQQKYDLAQHTIQRIHESIASISTDELSNLVGDALQQAVQQNEADLQSLYTQKRILYTLANERHALGREAMRYIPWLDGVLVHDQQDLDTTLTLTEKMRQFQPIHVQLQAMRTVIRSEQARVAELEAIQERRRLEAEENERFRQEALSMVTEAKPGMVWNPTTREYQALNTDESWRD